jgi:hypothetical protein
MAELEDIPEADVIVEAELITRQGVLSCGEENSPAISAPSLGILVYQNWERVGYMS